MVTYKKFIENKLNNNISINENKLKQYYELLKQYVISILDHHNDNVERLKNFKLDINHITTLLNQIQYPYTKYLLQSLQGQNEDLIDNEEERFFNWYKNIDHSKFNLAREVLKIIWDVKQIRGGLEKSSIEEEMKYVNEVYAKTQGAMVAIKKNIHDAISRIDNWGNSPISIDVYTPEIKDMNLEPIQNAEINFISGEKFSPTFTMFAGGTLEIDDILDAGDDDFFSSPQQEQDYFNLIRELKKPGSTSVGKPITLYTARPIADRKIYENATEIPPNIFLANSYDHVEGIAADMGKRDIWKIRINDKYLLKTMDDGRTQYYQVVGTKPVPIRSIMLITPGE